MSIPKASVYFGPMTAPSDEEKEKELKTEVESLLKMYQVEANASVRAWGMEGLRAMRSASGEGQLVDVTLVFPGCDVRGPAAVEGRMLAN